MQAVLLSALLAASSTSGFACYSGLAGTVEDEEYRDGAKCGAVFGEIGKRHQLGAFEMQLRPILRSLSGDWWELQQLDLSARSDVEIFSRPFCHEPDVPVISFPINLPTRSNRAFELVVGLRGGDLDLTVFELAVRIYD